MRIDTNSGRFLGETADSKGHKMSGKRFLCLSMVLAILFSGVLAPLAQQTQAKLATNGPPSVETHDPYTIGPTTAKLKGFLTDMGTAASVDMSFEWGTDTSYGNTTEPKTTVGCPMSFYADLSGLTQGAEYHYRAKAVGDGTSYGEDVAFTTTTPPAVTTKAATPVSTTLATLNGNLISFGTSWGVWVRFEWGLTTSYGQQTWAEEAPMTGAFSATITGLSATTTYHFRAMAEGNDGTSYGDDMTFTTSDFGIPEVMTTGSSPPPVTATTAILEGKLVSLGSASSVMASFVWGTTQGGPYPEETTGQVKTATGDFSAKVSGLSPGTTLYYKAKAAGDGTGYGAERYYTTTSPATPPSVATDSADQIGMTTARINMNVTSFGSAHDVCVYFEWGLTASYGNTTFPWTQTSLGSSSASLTGLSADTAYHFRAVAIGDSIGYGYDMSFRTASTTPSVNTGTATSVTFVSARLNGRLANLGMATCVYVSFEYGSISGSYNNETTPSPWTYKGDFFADISAQPGTTYYYRAKAVAAGIGTFYGDEASFATDALPPGSNCWAVIVGVADYEYSSSFEGDLGYTDDDAQKLYDILSLSWGASHVKLLLNSQATKAGIESAVLDWLDPVEDADDTVLFFFCGHGGYLDYDQEPLDETDGRDEYIVPYDARYGQDVTMILDDELNIWLSSLESTRQVVIIDSCYSGGFIGGDFARDLSRGGRVVITATAENEVGWETSDLGHSVFAYFLLDGLEHLDVLDASGNNEISAEELFAYAEPRTSEYEATHDYESIQHPQIYDGYPGELTLIILVTITVDADPRVASVTLDGRVYPASDLPLSVRLLPGTNHTLSVAATICDDLQKSRYFFLGWDDGGVSATRTISVYESASYAAEYRTEYYLAIESDWPGLQGEGWYYSGTEVSLSPDATPTVIPGMRHILTWTVDGEPVSGNPITLKMDSAHMVAAIRTTQYELVVLSDRGETQGSGWYDAGSEVGVSVESSSGSIVRHFFAGWSGDSSAKTRSTMVVMDGPKTLEASWRTDYSRLYILIAGILIVGLVSGGVVFLRKRRASDQLPERAFDDSAP